MRVRCPHCHQPNELPQDTDLSDFVCGSCGSRFDVIQTGDQTETFVPGRSDTPGRSSQSKTIAHFELLETLGRGHFGTVWRAHDTELDRTVAVKVPRKDQLEPQEMELFLREARAAAQLRHPRIVPVHEVGRDNGVVYIVSDFVPGATLRQWLHDQHVTPREAAELCIKLAEALHHAHEAGVIHRDLKPGNIMMDADGEPHIMDFGLAKREAAEITMTMEGQVMGTPAYMSPEQARGDSHNADRRSDVYALGVTLFELLTGELPFRGQKRMLIVQILQDDPPSPRRLSSVVPPDLETICLKCLEKPPDRRFQTAQELADELQRYLRGEAILARPISSVERGWRWCRRKPVVAGLTAALLLVFLAGFLGVFVQWRRADYHAEVAETKAREATHYAGEAEHKAQQEREAREAMRVAHYNASMLSLEQFEEAAAPGRILQTLERLRPQTGESDLRNFAWRHWQTRVQQHTRIIGRNIQGEAWSSLRLSRDGKLIAWQSSPKAVHLADYPSGENLRRLEHSEDAAIGEFLPDSRTLVTVVALKGKSVIHFWNGETAALESTLDVGPAISMAHNQSATRNRFAISADGQVLVCRHDSNTFDVWNLVDRKRVHRQLPERVQHGSLSADGRVLATVTSDGIFAAWDLEAGTRKELGRLPNPRRHAALVTPDGRLVVCTSGSKTTVYRLSSGGRELQLSGWPRDLAVSGDGGSIAMALGTSVGVWDVHGRSTTLDGPRTEIYHVAISHDGSLLAAGTIGHRLFFWDVRQRKLIAELPAFDDWVRDVEFSRDDQQIIACDGFVIKSWDVAALQHPWLVRDAFDIVAHSQNTGDTEKVSDIEFSPDGALLVSAGGNEASFAIWDIATGLLKRRIAFKEANNVSHISIDPQGKRVAATGLSPGSVKLGIWEIATGREIKVVEAHRGSTGNFNRKAPMSFLNGGRTIVTSAELSNATSLWETDSLKLIKSVKGAGYAVADARTGEPIKALRPGGYGVVPSRDGSLVAAGAFSVQIWETDNWQLKHTFPAHGRVKGLAFSPDARTLAVSSVEDVAVRFFNMQTGALDARIRMPSACFELAFSPDGTLLACGCEDGTIRLLMASSATSTLELLAQREQRKLDRLRRRASENPQDAVSHNNLAWQLVTCPVEELRSPEEALEHARQALELNPANGRYLNTLGVAQFRNGEYAEAVNSLTRSALLLKGEDEAWNTFFLAMAYANLGDQDSAAAYYRRGRTWMAANAPGDDELQRFAGECLLHVADTRRGTPPEDGFSSRQAAGPPDTFVEGNWMTAWKSETADDQPEWLIFDFERAVQPTAVVIYESFNSGAVNRIAFLDGEGTETDVWSAAAPPARDGDHGATEISLNVAIPTQRVKVYLDSPAIAGFNQIDAVGLQDSEGRLFWARHVRASSTYQISHDAVCDPAGDVPLYNEGLLRSRRGTTAVNLRIKNESRTPVVLYWIAGEGQRRKYGEIAPDQTRVQPTRAGHLWVVADTRENAIGIFRAGEKERVIKVRTLPPASPVLELLGDWKWFNNIIVRFHENGRFTSSNPAHFGQWRLEDDRVVLEWSNGFTDTLTLSHGRLEGTGQPGGHTVTATKQ